MQWAIQDSGITFTTLNNNVAPLVKAIDEFGDTRVNIGYIPFTDIITGLENLDITKPTIFYGSTRIAELAANLKYKPGVWYTRSWFDPRNWKNKRIDLLNEDQTYLTVSELKNNWINEPFFVKSIGEKVLNGMVLEGNLDKDWWVEEHSDLKDDEKLVISPVKNIIQEWRFFLINGKIVTGSQYKHDGLLRIREPITENVWLKAKEMALDWVPAPNIVMDICLLDSGEFKVIEFNSINCAGFYASPIKPLLEEINSWETELWNNTK